MQGLWMLLSNIGKVAQKTNHWFLLSLIFND